VADPVGAGDVVGDGEAVGDGDDAGADDGARCGDGAVMVTAADASGGFARCAAPPVAVRATELTDEASDGTVSVACSCRRAELASTAPRSQEEVPLPLPQPKLNSGAPPTSGTACSVSVASGMVPPVAQAVTVHWADLPRSLAACDRTTWRQRLTREAWETVLAVELVPVGVAEGEPVGVLLAVAVGLGEVGVAAGDDLRVRVGMGDDLRVLVGLGDAVPLAVAEPLGDAVPEGEVVPDGESVADGEAVPDGLALPDRSAVVELGDADGLPEPGVDELGAWLGVAEGEVDGAGERVSVLVGDGDGPVEPGSCSGSHDSLVAVARPAAAAGLGATAMPTPEAAVSRTPPATRAAVAGRACAKRMKTPYQCCSLLPGNDLSLIRWRPGSGLAPLAAIRHQLRPHTPRGRHRCLTPLATRITE
jgi:hypothetical protein